MKILIPLLLLWGIALVLILLVALGLPYLVFTIGNPWLKDALRQRRYIIKTIYTLGANELQSIYTAFLHANKRNRGNGDSEFEQHHHRLSNKNRDSRDRHKNEPK